MVPERSATRSTNDQTTVKLNHPERCNALRGTEAIEAMASLKDIRVTSGAVVSCAAYMSISHPTARHSNIVPVLKLFFFASLPLSVRLSPVTRYLTPRSFQQT